MTGYLQERNVIRLLYFFSYFDTFVNNLHVLNRHLCDLKQSKYDTIYVTFFHIFSAYDS